MIARRYSTRLKEKQTKITIIPRAANYSQDLFLSILLTTTLGQQATKFQRN